MQPVHQFFSASHPHSPQQRHKERRHDAGLTMYLLWNWYLFSANPPTSYNAALFFSY
uniref:Uncharacterized protein n=1 Tax=Anguilla anguilla TaxID=7936 RepID=A0A0E9RQ09_ANGAN